MITQKIGQKIIHNKQYLYKNMRIVVNNRNEHLMLVSRFARIPKQLTYKVNIPNGENIDSNKCEGTLALHDNQKIALNYLLDNIYNSEKIEKGRASCTFVMDTGLGKSFIAAALVQTLKVKTLQILPDTSLLDQSIEIYSKYLPNIIVGQYHAKKKIDGDIVFMTINSALNKYFTFNKIKIPYFEYFKKFGLIIYDEIPNYATGTRQEIFWRANFKYVLGLTATPNERIDKMDILYQMHTGPLVYANKIKKFNINPIIWEGNVEAIKYYGPPEFTEYLYNDSTNMISVQKMITQFTKDPYRNALIVNKALKLGANGQNVFIFTEQRNHIAIIQKLLLDRNITPIIHKNKISNLMGGSTTKDLQTAINDSNIILITYGYGSEGTSIPKMNAIIFASPRKNKMRQILGRILRRGGDISQNRHIVDIIDYNTSIKSQFYTRKKVYNEKKFLINSTKISYEQITI